MLRFIAYFYLVGDLVVKNEKALRKLPVGMQYMHAHMTNLSFLNLYQHHAPARNFEQRTKKIMKF